MISRRPFLSPDPEREGESATACTAPLRTVTPWCTLATREKAVYTIVQKTELPAFRVWGQWRFKRPDIGAWIEGQRAALRNEEEK